ncbi:MAG: hypothetical protein NDJ18_07760, partial [candidate division Zixibacteria bacterium]|nr:hypothetical protein [candidate division Zixibacteria bacterium]
GGTSFAETIIEELLIDCLHIKGISCHERPEWLRNPEGNLLELDIYLTVESVAIEIQGPQHKRDLYGRPDNLARRLQNDDFKALTCLGRGISLICLDSEGIQSREFLRMNSSEQSAILSELISVAQKHSPCHIKWTSKDSAYTLQGLK